MVRSFERSRSSSFNFRRMFDLKSYSSDSSSHPSTESKSPMEVFQPVGSPMISSPNHKAFASCVTKDVGVVKNTAKTLSDIELMKERFAKLLLGEDMSGGGKGVSSALALSNAITNLSASVFGDSKKLEPMPADLKARWRKEVDWLLSVTDHIVELVPSKQQAADGSSMEIMVTKQRSDLLVNIPALRKLDAMLLDCLDNFRGQTEFTYVDFKDANDAEKASSRDNDKWWIPTVKIPTGGLSIETKKWIQQQKDAVNQVLKAAMAINAQVLSEMEIPESYIESLPKNGRASLGDIIYKSITDEYFDPDGLLSSMDLTSEHKVLDLKNRIEASIVIWKRKMIQKDGKSSWSSAISMEKRELFEERAETLLLILKHHFPGLPQSTLDISKIQYNKDVGHAVLESYSRVLESLAAAILNRVDDVIYADALAAKASGGESDENLSPGTPASMTLLDFMGWNVDQGEPAKKSPGDFDEFLKEQEHEKIMTKTPENKKISYLEKLEHWGGLRSPTARH
ncbi:rho guanine nucleotide exchange factor 8-like [Chenopodium quinoa]|uniref:rho guanine nucleotide exchange factor 8-like n=1 Tax=Chenopodium quinoa TaxID=63459 RepID=UPI000B790B8B|nr:rho guanine nucleotide exchange factor 8-like [Chenopodium quinoa]